MTWREPAAYTSCIRLDWLIEKLIVCFGARIGVRFDDPRLLRRLASHLPPRAEVHSWGAADRIYSVRAGTLFRNRTKVMQSDSREEIIRVLASELNESVARFAADLFVHAGVVGWKGKAIVIPGLSMSGKSTLVAELIRQGASYYSDEYAVIRADGRISSYPKLLSMRRPRGKPMQVSAESLGGAAGKKSLALGMVVVTEYKPATQWQPRPISGAECMMALLSNTVMARARPEMTMQRLRLAVQSAFGLQGPRGDASETAQALLTRKYQYSSFCREPKSHGSKHGERLV